MKHEAVVGMKGLEDFISQQNKERPASRATPTKKDPLLGRRTKKDPLLGHDDPAKDMSDSIG